MRIKKINWQIKSLALLVFSSFLYFLSCQKDEFPGRGTIGSKGGSMVSLDGKIKLYIPPNSISNTVTIRITEISDEIADYIEGIRIGKKYSIEPSDLVLSNPVTVEINYESENNKISNPANLGVLQLGTNEDKVVNNISVTNDLESKSLKFSINHFSQIRLVEFNNTCAFFCFYWNIPVIRWYLETPVGKSYLNDINIQQALSLWENETSSFKFERATDKASANIIFTEVHNKAGLKDLETNCHIHEETAGMMCFNFNLDFYNKTNLGEKDHVAIYFASDEINTSDENKASNIAERILTHEVGHALGIAHMVQSSSISAVMNESMNSNDFWDGKLDPLDIYALHENYIFNHHNSQSMKIEILVDSLEYPNAIFIDNNKLYYTESARHNTSSGGRSSLNVYDLTTNKNTVLKNSIDCSDAIVVIDEKIYLSTWYRSIPGEEGLMSIFDTIQKKETNITYIDISTTAMCLDSYNNIYLLGCSDKADAKSLLKFSAPYYISINPVVLLTGLGRAFSMTINSNDLYYSDLNSIWKVESSLSKSLFYQIKYIGGMTVYNDFIYYSDILNNRIGRINMQLKSKEVLFDTIPEPSKMTVDRKNGSVYVLSHGTSANNYKDGKLLKITNIELRR